MALGKGASFVVCLPGKEMPFLKTFPDVSFLPYANPRFLLSKISYKLYPGHPPFMAAVTGTNGKSSVVNFVRQIFGANGTLAASIGTLGVTTTNPNFSIKMSSLTTPGALELHQLLEELCKNNIQVAALEASSHGLDQYRLHHVPLSCAGFTNLSQDHLDYHTTMEAYFEAKSKLFTEVLPAGKPAVLNEDSPYFDTLSNLCQSRQQPVFGYSIKKPAFLNVLNIRHLAAGFSFDLTHDGKTYKNLKTDLIGQFQLENMLCAVGLSLACDLSIDQCIEAVSSLVPVDGRMDYAGTLNGASIYVDYAHTPDALKTALESLRPHCSGDLWVVFGCGGNRDALKRPLMGKMAGQWADRVIVTDDNPRFENPLDIRAQILEGCPTADEVADRQKAILFAIAQLKAGDILLVAGKGHECGQIIGDQTLPFNDKHIIQGYLSEES